MIVHDDPLCTLYHGDCVEVMRELPAESVDAIVTDPPYGLEFMGKEWDRLTTPIDSQVGSDDSVSVVTRTNHRAPVAPPAVRGDVRQPGDPTFHKSGSGPHDRSTVRYGYGVPMARMQAWHEAWAREAFRVAKPGAHLLAFGGTRTYHRLAAAIEDAGWEIRDCLVYAYASGFPKSASVSKASTLQSWAALLPSAPHSSGTGEGSEGGYRSGCRLCGQPLRPVSVAVRDDGRLSADAPGCSHQPAPSVDIQLGSGRTYRACHACLSCRPSTPDCAHLASAPQPQRDARESSSDLTPPHRNPDDGPQLWPLQTPDADTPARSNGASPSEAKPRRSGTAGRTVRRGQSEAYTHSTLGCPSCHQLYAQLAVDRDGYGSALKPAWEPVVMARKPLSGTIVRNVLAYGTGALNIDGTRIPTSDDLGVQAASRAPNAILGKLDYNADEEWRQHAAGRWPANLLLTDPIFDGDTPGVVGGGETTSGAFPGEGYGRSADSIYGPASTAGAKRTLSDTGTYSRFFLIPKAARSDREPLVRGGLEERPVEERNQYASLPDQRMDHIQNRSSRANVHPTVKPLDLMRHLVRLVTPPGGTVLDCFLGSGTTAIAANAEGFRCIGIEREREYLDIALARMAHQPLGLGLDVAAPTRKRGASKDGAIGGNGMGGYHLFADKHREAGRGASATGDGSNTSFSTPPSTTSQGND